MIIYGDLISPFVRMTVVTAHEAGISNRVSHVVEPVKPTEVNAKLAKLSPLGKIPILETERGEGIYDSRVIMEYLCHEAGDTSIFPIAAPNRFRVLTLLALGQGLAESAVGYRYETAVRPKGLQWEDWMSRTETRMKASFDDLEARWMSDLEPVNAGAIAVAVTLAYMDFRLPDLGWRNGRQKLAAWHEAFSTRDSMQKTALTAK